MTRVLELLKELEELKIKKLRSSLPKVFDFLKENNYNFEDFNEAFEFLKNPTIPQWFKASIILEFEPECNFDFESAEKWYDSIMENMGLSKTKGIKITRTIEELN